ncbi:MAG: thiol reductase thioredoxin [Proteobacteria bacterium]|jgi:thioredoxin 2|nr:thiol reductase thioredoxin [Pseudomonadota bacterium]
MPHLSADSRGLILVCPACSQANRRVYPQWDSVIRCGRCKAELPRPAAVVDVQDPQTFSALVAGVPCPVFVDFWAPWCGPCRSVAPEIERLAGLMGDQALIVKVDTEAVPQVATAHRIQSIPTFVVFRGGSEVARTSGAMSASRLKEFIDQTAR